MITTLLLAMVAVVAAVASELFRLRRTYESVYALLLTDRDQARKEAETLRAALFPQLSRLVPGGPESRRPSTPSGPPSPETIQKLATLFPPRIPWRVRFKQLAAQHNTKQIGLDRHAAAISQAKETPHA
jgi:hypothetical protein